MFNTGIARFLGIDKWIDDQHAKRLSKKERASLKSSVAKRNTPKIFVIGFNKTGTTSIEAALKDHGFILGNQVEGELLLKDVVSKNYEGLTDYLTTGEAFQDVPFSLPNLYRFLYERYPDARFILSVRSSSAEWYNSLARFHGKLWGSGKLPNEQQLRDADYRYKGFAFDFLNAAYGRVDYDETHYTNAYEQHIADVRKYFEENQGNLLELNVADKDAYLNMCEFLNIVPLRESFEWKNKTQDIQ